MFTEATRSNFQQKKKRKSSLKPTVHRQPEQKVVDIIYHEAAKRQFDQVLVETKTKFKSRLDILNNS